MNSIIQKCLEELSKDSPKIDYVRGMLETILAMGDQPAAAKKVNPIVVSAPKETMDEARLLDARARAAIEQVKAMNIEE